MASTTSFLATSHLLSPPPPRHRPFPLFAISSSSSRSSFPAGGGIFSGILKLSRTKSVHNSCRRRHDFVAKAISDDELDSSGSSTPSDLPSLVLSERIVYIGDTLTIEVAESIFSQFLCLWENSLDKPIHLYINSKGSTLVVGVVLETLINKKLIVYFGDCFTLINTLNEAYVDMVIEDLSLDRRSVERLSPAPIYTLCVGHAWGESTLLLASGEWGHRAALPTASIMMREPITRIEGRVTFMLYRMMDLARIKADLVQLFAQSTGQSPEQIEADMETPKYFSPEEAVEYGIIDRVVRPGRARG